MWPALINLINSNARYWRTQTQRANDPQPEKIRFWTMITALATCGGILLAFAAAIAIWKQFGAMVDANKSSDAAFKASDAALKLDQRAWAGIREIKLSKPVVVGKPVEIAVTAINTGKTPALKIVLSEVRIGPSETDRNRDFVMYGNEYEVIAPNGADTFLEAANYDDNSVKAILAGTISIYIRGKFEYSDIWGKETHTTTFCSYYNAMASKGSAAASDYFLNCKTGNSMN
jgi:hypothetical protein